MSKNLSNLSSKKSTSSNLFEELGNAALETGVPSVEKMRALAAEFNFGEASVLGTASFYDFLKPGNRGKEIYCCNGSACLTAGTQEVLKEKLSGHFTKEETGEICCLGRCHENSSFRFEGKNYSGNAVNNLDKILKGEFGYMDKYFVGGKGEKVLTGDYDFDFFARIIENALQLSPEELLSRIELSGLRGRGGAGFPLAFKLESCKKTEGDEKYIVCNADEGDPGAYSDRYLLEEKPFSVLAGMMISGFVTGAGTGILYIRSEYPESINIVGKAIRCLEEKKLSGDFIQGSKFSFHFKIIKAQGAYVCGEETALLSSIEGQRPEVRVRPPYPTQQGLYLKPTVVTNVETLANLPFIISNGGGWFSSLGTKRASGTKLMSLDGYFNRPGIYEVEMGTPLSEVIKLAGGFRTVIKALHIGGPLGGIVPVSKIDELEVDFESFSGKGFLFGHASVICIPEKFPMIRYLEHLFAFTAHESCGKCFPCRLGSVRGFEMINKTINSEYKINRELFSDLLSTLELGSLCALGGGLPLPVKNALEYFGDELSDYFEKQVL